MNVFPTSLVALALCSASIATACMNTSYSPREEKQITHLTANITKVIMGEHPVHSEEFWYRELRRTEAKLSADPNDVESLNDRAVALTKLKRYAEAENMFLDIESRFPGRYKTASNLGVLYKKTKRFKEGAAMTQNALFIKPSGHLGLGDYYLRMLAWRAKVAADPTEVERSNFLGISRTASTTAVISVRSSLRRIESAMPSTHPASDNYPKTEATTTQPNETRSKRGLVSTGRPKSPCS